MTSEELVSEIKREISGCERHKREAEMAIAVANEQRERYAETLDILHYLLGLAEQSAEESEQKGGENNG